jgi:FkbM family methyltransferase
VLKKAIQWLAGQAGYRIEKIRQAPPGSHVFVLDYVLNVLNERRGGDVRFIQIGANDGLQEDPVRAWITTYPWSGVLVEPQPSLVSVLRTLYVDNPRIIVEQALVSNKSGKAKFYYFKTGEMNVVASMSRAAIETHRHSVKDFDAALAEVELDCVTFPDLLAKHRMERVDFLQIDAEGHDLEILKTIDLDRLRPPVICYENCNLSSEDAIICRTMLSQHGYSFANFLGDTVACLPEMRLVTDDRQLFVRT